MSYPITAIGDLAPVQGETRPIPTTTKLALAGLFAGGLLYASPEFKRWESRLSSVQKVGLALGAAGLFLGVMQIAMQIQRERRMLSYERNGPGGNPYENQETPT